MKLCPVKTLVLKICARKSGIISIKITAPNIFPNFICVTYRHFIYRMI